MSRSYAASSSRFSAARRQRGRWRRGRSRQGACSGSVFCGQVRPRPLHREWMRFGKGCANSGLVEGRDVVIELRYAQGGLQQLPELAAELVRLKVDVFQASGDLAPRVAQQATAAIPIVAFSDDILGAGLIPSLSRPGGNMTGLTLLSPELSAKRLEVLRELLPGKLSRVAALWIPPRAHLKWR